MGWVTNFMWVGERKFKYFLFYSFFLAIGFLRISGQWDDIE